MQTVKHLYTILLSFIWCNCFAQELKKAEAFKHYYKHIISQLTDSSLYGRPCCSSSETQAADLIAEEMKKLSGKKPHRQLFSILPKDSTQTCTSQNVYCYINNKSKKTIIIGAHYDHLGYGGSLSKSIGKKQIHPGADDNASGVALTLGLMKSKLWRLNKAYNYLFVAYSAHEVGLYGSAEFYRLCSEKFGSISLVINFDMVGRMDTIYRMQVVYGGLDFYNLKKIFPEKDAMINSRLDDSTRLFQLDTKAFRESGIPCLSFTTGLHNDYHKTSDTEALINYNGIWLIQKKLMEFFTKPEQFQFKNQ